MTNHPDIELLKYDQNTEAFQAFQDDRGAALSHDNTLLFAWARENESFSASIPPLGSLDVISPGVKKATLLPAYGDDIDPEEVVVEGGKL